MYFLNTKLTRQVKLFLLVILTVFTLLSLFFLIPSNPKKLVSQNPTVSLDPSLRLMIPSINVNAHIQHVGITQKGEMDVPSNIVDVGWYEFGTRPGEKGSAVIAGHFDGRNGEIGVFANLHKLQKGDKLYIEDEKGKSIAFMVQKITTYNPGYADIVFNQNDSAHLNLITCGGIWDETEKSYSKRLVVFADIVP